MHAGLLSILVVACSADFEAAPLAVDALRERAEARIVSELGSLRDSIGHLSLVAPVAPTEVARNLARVSARQSGADIVLGSATVVEPHGGGILALLLANWRPGGRNAELGDRYTFDPERPAIELAEIYRSHRRQIFLPVAGVARESINGALPEGPVLPRMRFERRTGRGFEVVEVDAYAFLGLLVEREADLDRTWQNRLGQVLSTRLLLENAWRHFTVGGAAVAAPDHTELHLVELLLAYARRDSVARDPGEIKRSLLASLVDDAALLAESDTEELCHHVESLGVLLAEIDLGWTNTQKERAVRWLNQLQSVLLPKLANVPLQHLTHLIRGLRLVAEHAGRLE